MRVITELVVNHTSDQHPWFQRARRAPPGSRWRDFYVWSDTPGPLPRRPHHLPGLRDVELDVGPGGRRLLLAPLLQPPARPQLRQPRGRRTRSSPCSTTGWRMGVDGVRLDAVPYLFERDGTNCENLPETHEFLKRLRKHLDANYDERLHPGRGEPVARGRRRLLRRRRRVPHELPLPAHAAAVHVAAAGEPHADHRHPRADAAAARRAASGPRSCATTTS